MTQFDLIKNLRDIKASFDRIGNAVGNAKQEEIRRMYQNDWYGFTFLVVYLNPFVVFGIGEKSLEKKVDGEPDQEFCDLADVAVYLNKTRSASHQVILNVQNFLDKISDPDLRDFAEAYITKTLRLGVTGKTLNKALELDLIPEINCMLANKYFEHAAHVEGKEFFITEKLDGIRCLALVREGQIPVFYTRQGQIIEGLVEIEQELAEWANIHRANCMLDGELLIADREQYKSKEQYKRTTKIVRKDGEKVGIAYHVFDVTGNAKKDESFPYCIRREWLDKRVQGMDHVKLLPVLYQGYDTNMIHELLEYQRTLGHEGIMINIADAPYQGKRTNDLLKCKVMQDCDLKVIGFQEGSGKFYGTLGSITVDYKGNPVGVGSGLSDQMRHEIWNNQQKYLGRVATVQYFEETCDANGKLSIRFPVFKEFREEGKEVSYN